MLRRNSTQWLMVVVLIAVMALGSYLLPDLSSAQGGTEDVTLRDDTAAKANMDANTFISYLDSLRELGQTEAGVATVLSERERMVYDHTSDLDALHNQAAALSRSASTGSLDANGYISYLDQLRAMGSAPGMDANGYISYLDRLRAMGNAATTDASLVTR